MGAGHLDLNLADAMYGYLQCALGRPHDGMRRMLDSVATVRAHHTDDNYVIALSYQLIYNCLYELDEGETAISYLLRGYEMDERSDTTQFALAIDAEGIAEVHVCRATNRRMCPMGRKKRRRIRPVCRRVKCRRPALRWFARCMCVR